MKSVVAIPLVGRSRCSIHFAWFPWRSLILVAVLAAWSPAAMAQTSGSLDPQRDSRVTVRSVDPAARPDAGETDPELSERLITILDENSEARSAVKNAIAFQTSVDPATISDGVLFEQIRTDVAVRAQVAQELSKRGYDVNSASDLDKTELRRPLVRRGQQTMGTSAAGREAARPETRKLPEPRLEEAPTEPAVVQRPVPYPQLPSLKDLYSQYPARSENLKRFGSDTFRRGTGNANDLLMDVPVGPDYVLGPGDALVLNIWGSTSQRLNRTVDRQGQVAVPETGPVTVSGLNIAQAQDAIQKALRSQYRQANVEVSLGRVRTVRVYVVGDVQRPGAYDISSLSTVMNALYAAGGPTARGSLRTVRQYRGNQLVRDVDLYDLLLRGIRSDVDRLLPGDTVLVPPVGPQVSIFGMVRRPAIYELKGETGLKEALDLAGGVLVSATLREISVERIEAHERRTMLSVKLAEGTAQDAAANSLAAFRVQDGDQVRVAPILPYNEKAVYLQGHVFRPGKYAFHEGMMVSDLLRSYQDVMPEPADHAEIVRLQPPDFRPATISLNLSGVLMGSDPILLQPFDMIRVFGRYEIDPPKVTIYGEVLRPGEYPLAQGMTAAGLVRMAGGFKRSAYRNQADLTSYVVQNGQKILLKQTVVEISRAVEGDNSADVRLKPGDVLSIRQLTGWKDVGSSVVVNGEVAYAGSYGIAEGERLSSVLKRAGGFLETSYPAGATLDRVQVREMAEKTRQEIIRRLESTPINVRAGMGAVQEQQSTLQVMQQQREQSLGSLRRSPVSGRQVIHISTAISNWENTPVDIEMRAGDVLTVPKRPTFVTVTGQVYNAAAITYVPGKAAAWYLNAAGGPTSMANKKAIYVVRPDGSVIGHSGKALGARLEPGATVVVPERIFGGTSIWRDLIASSQMISTIALTAAVALK